MEGCLVENKDAPEELQKSTAGGAGCSGIALIASAFVTNKDQCLTDISI